MATTKFCTWTKSRLNYYILTITIYGDNEAPIGLSYGWLFTWLSAALSASREEWCWRSEKQLFWGALLNHLRVVLLIVI